MRLKARLAPAVYQGNGDSGGQQKEHIAVLSFHGTAVKQR